MDGAMDSIWHGNVRAAGIPISLASILVVVVALGNASAEARALRVETLVPPTVMHGLEGLALDRDGNLYGASFFGQAIYKIELKTNHVTIAVSPPEGEGDDVAIGPEGTSVAGMLAWTSAEEIRGLRPGGKPIALSPHLPRLNPIAFSRDGRLFTSQSGTPENELWEIDPEGHSPPRLVTKGQGPLNGFGFGPDGQIYAPLFGTDQIVAVDPETGIYTKVASGVGSPSGVKVDSQGNLVAVDYKRGDVWYVRRDTGEVKRLAASLGVIDNLAIAPDDTVFLSDPTVSSVLKMNIRDGRVTDVIRAHFNTTLGLAMTVKDGRPTLIVADPMGYHYVDAATGKVARVPWEMGRHGSNAVATGHDFIVIASPAGLRKIDVRSDQVLAETKDIKTPAGVVVLASGDVIAASPDDGRIVRWNGQATTTIASGLRRPSALILDSDDAVLVAESEGDTISRINLSNGMRADAVRDIAHPTGLAKLSGERLAIADSRGGNIAVVDLRSGKRTKIAEKLALSVAGLRVPQTTPTGLVAKGDTLYVACPGNNSILKIKTDLR
jgi:sugar lactone lactonase YvrE